MIYDYKIQGLFPVPAQTAGEELERIREKDGALTPKSVVDESRPQKAPLHPCFEWNDAAAAEKYRKTQARCLIRCVTVRAEESPALQEPLFVRAFHHSESAYQPLRIMLDDANKRAELLDNARRELRWFKTKYQTLSELVSIFEAIDNFIT